MNRSCKRCGASGSAVNHDAARCERCVVRLRSPFDRAAFPAAASTALGELAGEELAKLIQRAA